MLTLEREGELKYLHIKNESAEAKIALQGAHVFYFKAKSKPELLYLSRTALFKQGTPIRGGIPICWPWFGEHPTNKTLPNHGFARVFTWEHLQTKEINPSQTEIRLSLKSSPETLTLFPFNFKLILTVLVGKELEMELTTTNLDTKAFSISNALHTYFKIDEISKAYITGVDKKRYYNKVDNSFNNLQKNDLYFTKEIDRVYEDVPSELVIKDKDQDIIVKTEGSKSAVIWNPGDKGVENFIDLDSHKQMLCLESANVMDDSKTVEPSLSHSLKVTFVQLDNKLL